MKISKMNKKTIGAVAIVILAIAVISVWQFNSFQKQINNLQTLNNELRTQNSNLTNQITGLEEQYSDLQNKTFQIQEQSNYSSPVKITSFEYDNGFYPVAGLTLEHPVTVTVKNYADFEVSELSWNVKLVNKTNGSEIGNDVSLKIDPLQPGESRVIRNAALANIGADLSNAACIVSIRGFNHTVLDEWTRDISLIDFFLR